MTVLLIVLASIAAYLIIGWRLAVWDVPRSLAYQRKHYPSITRTPEDAAGYAVPAFVCMTLAWPIAWPVCHSGRSITRQISKADPVAQRKAIESQASRIAELEREMGMR